MSRFEAMMSYLVDDITGVDDLFDTLDTDESGSLNFHEFVAAFYSVRGQVVQYFLEFDLLNLFHNMKSPECICFYARYCFQNIVS